MTAVGSAAGSKQGAGSIPLRKSAAVPNLETQLAEHGAFLHNKVTITHTKDWWSFAQEAILIGGSLAALFYMFNSVLKANDPTGNGQRKEVSEQIKSRILMRIAKTTGRRIRRFETTSYEDSLLTMIVLPGDIHISFRDIGGLDHIKRDLMETVLIPLMNPSLVCHSRLCVPPLGVLFYGAPGTGKSMMAKAVCRETEATFFNVDMSKLMSKWYGDSQKYISALFSLARKMAPSIIWIDEIDALFSMRGGGGGSGRGGGGSGGEHQADVYNKALFLSLWDGLATSMESGDASAAGVIIIGATNRPQSVDEAFLRRMPRQYEFPMPDVKTRNLILNIFMKYEQRDATVNLDYVANQTEHYSGSDLKEVCKYAATMPLKEHVRKAAQQRLNHQRLAADVSKYVRTSATAVGEYLPSDSSDCEDETNRDDRTTPKGDESNIMNDSGGFLNSLYTISPFSSSNLKSSTDGTDGSTTITPGSENEREPAISRYTRDLSKQEVRLRPISMKDFEEALSHIKSTLVAHSSYETLFGRSNAGSNLFRGGGGAYGSSSFWNPMAAAAAASSSMSRSKASKSSSSRVGSQNSNNNSTDPAISSLGLD